MRHVSQAEFDAEYLPRLLEDSQRTLTLKHLTFEQVKFPETDIQNVAFINCVFNRTQFNGTRFKDVNFTGSTFHRAVFNKARLTDCDFSKTTLTYATFLECDLRHVSFQFASLSHPRIIESQLRHIAANVSTWTAPVIEESLLADVDFSNARINRIMCMRTKITTPALRNSHWSGGTMWRVNTVDFNIQTPTHFSVFISNTDLPALSMSFAFGIDVSYYPTRGTSAMHTTVDAENTERSLNDTFAKLHATLTEHAHADVERDATQLKLFEAMCRNYQI